jgi:hypothetical protein
MKDDFLKKLMVSKAIMEKHNAIPRNTNGQISESNFAVQTFDETPVNATYNLPEEYVTPTQTVKAPMVTEDRIKNSKLPDAIKKLMLEHPIAQPQQVPTTSVLSDEMIERASKLMNNGKTVVESKKTTSSVQSNPDLKRMIKESVKEILSEYGVIPESSEEVNEVMVIKVGKHIFEGKISKIKKVK